MTQPDHLFVHARRWSRPGTAGQFVTEARSLLTALAGLDSRFDPITVVTGPSRVSPTLSAAGPAFEGSVLPLLYQDEDSYEDLGPDRTIAPGTRSKWGFGQTFLLGDWPRSGLMVGLSGMGIKSTYADVHVDFPAEVDGQPGSEASAEEVMRIVIEHWHPLGAWLTSSRFHGHVPGGTAFSVGWLTYLRDPKAAAGVIPGIAVESFADGRLIRLGPTFRRDSDQLAEAVSISGALGARGFLSMPPRT